MCSLFSDLVNDSLTEYTYDADLAGLAYNLGAHSFGIAISLNGYNDKLPDLTRRIIEATWSLQVRQDRLEVMKEKVNWILLYYYLCEANVLGLAQASVGKLFHVPKLPAFGLLRTAYPHARYMDSGGAATRSLWWVCFMLAAKPVNEVSWTVRYHYGRSQVPLHSAPRER